MPRGVRLGQKIPMRSMLSLLSKISFATALGICLFAATPGWARLGETEAQSKARYGEPVDGLIGGTEQPLLAGAKELAYNFQGWRVRVAFVNGTAARIEYAKIPDAGGLKKLTDPEVLAILEAEKGTYSWREEKPRLGNAGLNALKTVFDGRIWERSDHAMAKFKLGLVLVLETREAEALEKKMAKEPAKPAAGAGVPKF